MNTTPNNIFTITGGIMLLLFLLGAFANAYGASITITQISNLVWIVLVLVIICVHLSSSKKI